jgi:hypothetical protein
MYRERDPGDRRAAYEPERPAPADQVRPAAGPSGGGDGPTHLVLLNGAEDRMGAVFGVAGEFARRAGAAVRAAYLHTPPPPGDMESIRLLSAASLGGPAAHACGRFVRTSGGLAGRARLAVLPELLFGPADPTLAGYLRANEFDLVTVTTDGSRLPLWAGGLWSVVAGWRPVLVVGPNVGPLWSAGSGPSGEVVAVLDGTAAAEAVLAPAASLCRLLDGRLTLMWVGRAAPADSGAECHRYLLDIAGRVRPDVPAVRAVVSARRPVEAVLSVQQATGAVIAVARPVRSLLTALTPGRAAVRLLRESTGPVLFHRPPE